MLQYLEHQEGVKIVIDYFSCTFPLKLKEDELELIIIEDLVKYIAEYMGFDSSEINKEEYSTNRFKYQYSLGEAVTLRLSGPTLVTGYKSCQIEMRGQGCREFEAHSSYSWIELFNFFMIGLQGSPTRLDIAIDDYEGRHATITKIKETLDKGNYTTSFRKKYYKLMGCDQEGWSIQFGSHKSTMMLVIYDKLKEQQSKGNEINQEFWTRYEMRFMKDKAYDVVFNLIDQGEDNFNNYSYGLLYSLLDIKEDSNYDENNLYKANTAEYWSEFLNKVSKSDIAKYKVVSRNIDTYKNWILPIMSSYFIIMHLHNGRDFQTTYNNMLSDLLDYIDKIDKKKIKKINQYQDEVGQRKITMKDIQEIKAKIKDYISKHQLPF